MSWSSSSSSSTLSPSPSSSIPIVSPTTPSSSNNGLDLFTKLFLIFIFLSLFLRICYVLISTLRDLQGNNNNSNSNNNDTSMTHDSYGDEDENQHPTGLPIHVINSYHSFPYSNKINVATICDLDATCSICIEEYQDSEMLRMMPQCRHYFHRDCVDEWLKVHSTCPVCRNSLLEPININGGTGAATTMERL